MHSIASLTLRSDIIYEAEYGWRALFTCKTDTFHLLYKSSLVHSGYGHSKVALTLASVLEPSQPHIGLRISSQFTTYVAPVALVDGQHKSGFVRDLYQQ